MPHRRILFAVFVAFCFTFRSFGFENYNESKFSISGYVKDAKSGEDLIGATVYIVELKSGVNTNAYGFYSINAKSGTYTLQVGYLGYKTIEQKVELTKNIALDFELQEATVVTQEVLITEYKADENIKSVQMSMNRLTVEQMKKVPALFGEVDVIKNIQMLPGVQSAGEGTSAFFVRGGAADQNLILLDEAPVYNPQHLFGIFSTFNADVIKSADVYKGGIPAQYGGRLSSVVDIRTKDGNLKDWGGTGTVGLLSSKIALEGPFVKDKGSIIISGRRTYFDAFTRIANQTNKDNKSWNPLPNYYFYDFNVKANYRVNNNNRLFVAGYFGKDLLDLSQFGMDWGNATGTLRWNHIFSSRLFSNTSLVYSNFNYGLGVKAGAQAFDWRAQISEVILKQDFNYFITPSNELRFGGQWGSRAFQPGNVKPASNNSIFKEYNTPLNNNLEHSYYVSNDQKISSRFSAQYGVRLSVFHNNGATIYQYANNIPEANKITDTIKYHFNQIDKSYMGWEPRVGVKYDISTNSSIKASYNRMYQYLHMLTPGAVPLPITMWLPSSRYIKPQIADQIAAGYFMNFNDNMFECSAEIYYKQIKNAVDFKDNAQLLLNPTVEADVVQGKGKSYGLELYIRKTKGKLTGSASYTLSRTELTMNGINNNQSYLAPWNRTHNFNTMMSYQLSERWSIGAGWQYMTGRPVTLPVAEFDYGHYKVQYYSGRNAELTPDFHRLDVSANLKSKPKEGRKWEGMWNFSVYNAYYRKNPFSVYVETNNDTGNQRIMMSYLLGVIPSAAYTVSF